MRTGLHRKVQETKVNVDNIERTSRRERDTGFAHQAERFVVGKACIAGGCIPSSKVPGQAVLYCQQRSLEALVKSFRITCSSWSIRKTTLTN